LMRQKIAFVAFLLWAWCAIGATGLGQDRKPPLTREEVLQLLKPVPGTRYEQGDLAAEIADRGIAFPVDEKTLGELRRAGARSFLLEAIQQAARNAARPEPPRRQPPEADQPAARAAALARLPLLEQARYHALEFVEELPNFIVTQFVTRYVRT